MKILLLLSLLVTSVFARNVQEWNLPNSKLAVQGYDVVSYFNDSGPLKGSDLHELNHEGVLYKFSSQQNLNEFLNEPNKYEPAHGGWCATAMASGQKIVINPLKYVIEGKRLFLFSFLNGADARVMWLQNPARLERRADFNWKRISGEDPRK